jgi:tetratricopeptide (TPR) repeat protein
MKNKNSNIAVLILSLLVICLFTACQSAGDKLAADGAKAYGEKDYAQAIELLESADSLGLNKYKQYELDLMLAEAYLKTGNLDKCIAKCDWVINETQSTGHYSAYNIKGIAQKQAGDYQAALESYLSAMEFDEADGDSVGLYNNIGNVYISINEPLKALEYLNKAINLDPSFAEAYGNIAVAYAILFDFDSANRALADAVSQGYDKAAEVQAIIDKYAGFEDFAAGNR